MDGYGGCQMDDGGGCIKWLWQMYRMDGYGGCVRWMAVEDVRWLAMEDVADG